MATLDDSELVVPQSMLDTDLYKLTMQQAILHHFPDVQATYRFTHRSKKDVKFSRKCVDRFRRSVPHFAALALTAEERACLEKHCPYFTSSYLDHLAAYRFKPEQVTITFVPVSAEEPDWGDVEIEAVGLWSEAIFWEVPLMACLSEQYFRTVDTDWTYDGQSEKAYEKAKIMFGAQCAISEFGTRRRRSHKIQDMVVGTLVKASKDMHGQGKLSGTSNVHLAMKHDLNPVGTIAHEWFMGIAAFKGYEHANGTALDLWEQVYPNSLLLALTDTFSTEVFFRDFVLSRERAARWSGLRQDSGDPFVFAPNAKKIYAKLGIDHTQKMIIFSDGLDVDKVLKLKAQCDAEGFLCSFGIGTSLTNDFPKASGNGVEKSKALNMVIKLASVNGKPCVKISDERGKHTGDPEEVKVTKAFYGLS